jgi:hypothetical protein
MKNLAKLFLQSKQQSGKAKPRESASTARKVGQMRNAVRQMTGYKKGGTMTKRKQNALKGTKEALALTKTYALEQSLKDRDRLTQRDIEKAKKLQESESKKKGREKAKKVKKRFKDFGEKASGFVLEIIGKQTGGIARPPTRRAQQPRPPARRAQQRRKQAGGLAMRGYGIAKRGY